MKQRSSVMIEHRTADEEHVWFGPLATVYDLDGVIFMVSMEERQKHCFTLSKNLK